MSNENQRTQRINDIDGNAVTYIDPNLIDKENFGLQLYGEHVSDLSHSLNNNFVRLTQNFYGDVQPINPIIGQNWLNKTDNIMYRWMGDNWVQTTRDTAYDSFMLVKYDVVGVREFVLDDFVFNFTINNIKLYDQNLQDVKFVIDLFDSRKIILKESNVTILYIMVFHPKDRVSNPFVNRRQEIITESGQTQFDIGSFLGVTNINTLSVALNGVMMKNNEFYVVNNILNIDGMVYRVLKDDKLKVWLHGGSHTGYYTNLRVHTSRREKYLKIPKFFQRIEIIEIIDIDNKVTINPIEVIEYDDYFYFEFLNEKNVITNIKARIL